MPVNGGWYERGLSRGCRGVFRSLLWHVPFTMHPILFSHPLQVNGIALKTEIRGTGGERNIPQNTCSECEAPFHANHHKNAIPGLTTISRTGSPAEMLKT